MMLCDAAMTSLPSPLKPVSAKLLLHDVRSRENSISGDTHTFASPKTTKFSEQIARAQDQALRPLLHVSCSVYPFAPSLFLLFSHSSHQ